MKIVGLTGGIACGKSSLSRLLGADPSIEVIDADAVAHAVLTPGRTAYRSVVKEFGSAVLGADGILDRKALGRVVFKDTQARRRLNAIVNGWIAWDMLVALLGHWMRGTVVVVLDVPLLFETGMNRICSEVVVVTVPAKVQLQRLMERDKAGEADARARIEAQPMSLEEKAARATYPVMNDRAPEDLARAAEALLPKLKRLTLVQRLLSGPVVLTVLLLGSLALWLAR